MTETIGLKSRLALVNGMHGLFPFSSKYSDHQVGIFLLAVAFESAAAFFLSLNAHKVIIFEVTPYRFVSCVVIHRSDSCYMAYECKSQRHTCHLTLTSGMENQYNLNGGYNWQK